MNLSTRTLVATFVAAVMMGMPCLAQEVEPPFTWAGEGTAAIVSEDGIEEIDFQFELSIDEQGMFEGQTSNESGPSRIRHVFYGDQEHYDFGGLFSRKVVLVILINEYGDNPMLGILNGRLLVDEFFYGEVLLARYEAGSTTAGALGVGDPEATYLPDAELSWELRSALKRCLPVGTVRIEGGFKQPTARAAAGGDAVALGATPTPIIVGQPAPTMPDTGIFDDIGQGGGVNSLATAGLAVLGLAAVIVVARRLRNQ